MTNGVREFSILRINREGIAETLSNLTGKWIKKVSDTEVEFKDGTKINIKDLDLIKPLIWWEQYEQKR